MLIVPKPIHSLSKCNLLRIVAHKLILEMLHLCWVVYLLAKLAYFNEVHAILRRPIVHLFDQADDLRAQHEGIGWMSDFGWRERLFLNDIDGRFFDVVKIFDHPPDLLPTHVLVSYFELVLDIENDFAEGVGTVDGWEMNDLFF